MSKYAGPLLHAGQDLMSYEDYLDRWEFAFGDSTTGWISYLSLRGRSQETVGRMTETQYKALAEAYLKAEEAIEKADEDGDTTTVAHIIFNLERPKALLLLQDG